MQEVELLCRCKSNLLFGYSWYGSSNGDERDTFHQFGRSTGRVGGYQKAVDESYWFKGYKDAIKAEVKVISQLPRTRKINLICIKGGPISQHEASTMKQLVKEISRDLNSKGIQHNVFATEVTFEKFLQDNRSWMHSLCAKMIRGKKKAARNNRQLAHSVTSRGSVAHI